MQKQPFDTAGVNTWQTHLYALPDAQLGLEADEAFTQLQVWLHKQFDFTPTQAAYVDELDPEFISVVSGMVSNYVRHRLPIALETIEPPVLFSSGDDDDDDEGRGKLILLSESQQVVFSQTEGLLSVGHLQVTIRQPTASS